jgi:hypothetical protein
MTRDRGGSKGAPLCRGPLRVLIGLATLALLAAATQVAATDPTGGMAQATRERLGLRYENLESAPAGSACAPVPYRLEIAPGIAGCTHGPDPAPAGVDVRVAPSLAQLNARADAAAESIGGVAAQGAAADGTVPCIGHGTSGKRLEAIYAYRDVDASRYASVAPLIRTWAAAADEVFDQSAATTGGSRHLRWLHDANCQPIVQEVAISAEAAEDFSTMIFDLYYAGFNRTDRRYVIWVDFNYYCGIAMTDWDESPGQNNIHNGVPAAQLGLMARIDVGCWGQAAPATLIEAHEISHTLGAVQPHSPNSSSVVYGPAPDEFYFYGHCVDEYDTMCYPDGTPKGMVYRCTSVYERLLDCNHDDYFNTNPGAGTYLATNWNTANSSFLVKVDPVAGFIDLGGSPFSADIAWLAQSGITTGCSADGERFCPLGNVTRGQMAAFLVRALDLAATPNDYFTDDETSIFEDDINRLAAAGITAGCSATTYCPNATITRGQMAAFLARALVLPPTTTDFFTDDETSIFEGDINRTAAAGITSGCGGGRYCPTLVVTREQMAAFLHRALD